MITLRDTTRMAPCVLLTLGFLLTSVSAQSKNLKAFPEAAEGQKRFVIPLPHKSREEEGAYKVEIMVGKVMETDGVNRIKLSGELEAKPLKGWGFTFYQVAKLGPGLSTRIGVPEGTPKVRKFVEGPSTIIRYNSRVPVVVYVPQDAEVRYRIWKAAPEFDQAREG